MKNLILNNLFSNNLFLQMIIATTIPTIFWSLVFKDPAGLGLVGVIIHKIKKKCSHNALKCEIEVFRMRDDMMNTRNKKKRKKKENKKFPYKNKKLSLNLETKTPEENSIT